MKKIDASRAVVAWLRTEAERLREKAIPALVECRFTAAREFMVKATALTELADGRVNDAEWLWDNYLVPSVAQPISCDDNCEYVTNKKSKKRKRKS